MLSLQLGLLESIQKFLNAHKTAANFDSYIIALLDLDEHFPLSELVHALRLAQEHDFHLFFLGIGVDERCECLVDGVVQLGHVAVEKCVDGGLHLILCFVMIK